MVYGGIRALVPLPALRYNAEDGRDEKRGVEEETMKKLIEVALPVDAINREAAQEKST